jgi:HK97 gp10 family phage protein
MTFSYVINGLESLVKKCQKTTVLEPVNEGIRKVTEWMERTVKVSTPVDTGRLRSSMTSELIGQMGRVGTNVQYAPFVEFGTRFMEARHVDEGSSTRVLGKGMFTRAMELLQAKIKDFIDEIGHSISIKFG